MKFKEPLPESCPPSKVTPPNSSVLWRMLPANTVQASDFDSHAKRFPNKSYPDMCKARSVSLLPSLESCRAITKLPYPNVQNLTHAVAVSVLSSAGVWDKNGPAHISLWIAAGVDPLALTGKIEAL